MAVEITKKPTLAVTGLGAPTRNGYVMSASWNVPSALVNTNSDARAEQLGLFWYLGLDAADPRRSIMVGTSQKSSGFNLNGGAIGNKTYYRTSFYPVTKDKLHYVTFKIMAKNRKGWGPLLTQVRKFTVPRAPVIAALSFNDENGIVSTTVTTDEGLDYQERYDTRYTVTVTNPFVNGGKPKNTSDNSSRSTEFNLTYDASQYMNLSYSQYIQVTVTAWARGFKGDSSKVSRTMYVSYPAQPSITGVDVSSRSSTGKCTVRLKTNSSTTHPVDKVKLQYAADVEYDNASDIPASEWQDTEIIDNANCTALAMPVSDLLPSRGNHTWVRVVSYHLNEAVLYRYSEPVMVKDLETPATPTAQINIEILSAHAGEDGKSAVVHLGWNADGHDDFTGTELTWSDAEDTWKSTEDPSKHEFVWSDGVITSGGVTYNDSATITIKGLSEGKLYYIKARRYFEGERQEYSAYSNTATVLTSETPEAIVASAERYISKGNPLSVYWTFSGNGMQTRWQIVSSDIIYNYKVVDSPIGDPSAQGWYELINNEYVLTDDTEVDDGKTYYSKETYGTIIANGEGSTGATQISAERLEAFAVDDSVTFTVQASTGSDFVSSEPHTVTIIERPTLSVNAPEMLTAQPYSFTAVSNRLCDLVVIVTSQGVSGQYPQGLLTQIAGDTIHSDIYSPEWVESSGLFSATVTLPNGLDFWNLGNYMLSVVAVDRTTNLRSSEVAAGVQVGWENEAADIGDAVALTVINTADADGDYRRAVEIALAPPLGSNPTDVYDIYRMDIEKPSLIGRGFPLSYTVDDEYAPFGSDVPLKYRIALRTIDGDVSFADIEYEAPCESMRFDWATGSFELPYGLSIGDSFTKDVQVRQHLNGTASGYWNLNIERKSTLNSSIIKIIQSRDIERARMLARYAGAVFVRLPNGSAFTADVQVTDLSVKNRAVTAIAIDATEIELTDEFMLPTPFDEEEEEE